CTSPVARQRFFRPCEQVRALSRFRTAKVVSTFAGNALEHRRTGPARDSMDRLSRYLQGQFFAQALTIFAAGGALIWLMQLLRLFDLVSAQGQNFLTLMGQSALTTPTFARSILYVCFAIGLVRGLRALQASRELHTIHAAQRTGSLWRAIISFTL